MRRAALRRLYLSFEKSISIGFRSGEYLGRKKSFASHGPESAPDGAALMRAEIVHDDDVARLQGRDEDLLDVEAEALAVDRPLEQPWRVDPIVSQGSEEGHGRPAAMRHLGRQALTKRAPAAQRSHVGLGPGLVDEDQAGRIDTALVGRPLLASPCYVRAIPLAGDQRLFL